MKTAFQDCTLIIETDQLNMPGKGMPEFTLENMAACINHGKGLDIDCTLNYWQGEPKPVITIKIL